MYGMRVIRDPQRYGFAVGRIRVLETRLLKRSHFERLLDASDFAEQKRVLSETAYGAYLEGVRTAEDVEMALDRAIADLFADFVVNANLPEPIVDYFLALRRFESVRAALKAEALGMDVAELTGGELRAEIARGDAAEVAAICDRVAARIGTGEEGPSVAEIDAAVDIEYYAEIERLAEATGNEHVRSLARIGADIVNVRVFVRSRARSLPVAEALRWFVPGGGMTQETFAALYRVPVPDAAVKIASVPPLKGADPDAVADPARIDVVADNALRRTLRAARMVAIGPEPVVAYVILRRMEVAALRMLLIGKIAGVPRDVLREHMRDVA